MSNAELDSVIIPVKCNDCSFPMKIIGPTGESERHIDVHGNTYIKTYYIYQCPEDKTIKVE